MTTFDIVSVVVNVAAAAVALLMFEPAREAIQRAGKGIGLVILALVAVMGFALLSPFILVTNARERRKRH